MAAHAAPLLDMTAIGKSFPGVRALDGVSIQVEAGEIHALVGENGAGKSTLIKILAGIYPYPGYEGEVAINGQVQHFRGVADSQRAGVAVVHQELSLVPEMSVAENIFLGREPRRMGVVQKPEMLLSAARALEEISAGIPPQTLVRSLGVGQQQMVEIAKALSQKARLLVLDEPTAALTDAEAEHLMRVLQELAARGVGILYISHRLAEVFRISRRITVLRDGRSVGTSATADLDVQRVVAQMVGREITEVFPQRNGSHGDVVFEVRSLTARDRLGRTVVDDVSFSVHKGEVLGIAGLMGSGRTEILLSIFGAFRGGVSGEIRVNGRVARIDSPERAIAHGIALVTEDRKGSGLMLDQSVLRNMTLAALRRVSGHVITRDEPETAAAEVMRRDLLIKTDSLATRVGALSGGNQQKVVLAKWLLTQPSVLLLDEPTRGIDVGAKQEFYARMARLAAQGLGIVFVSSELEEVLGLADRILVVREGRIAGEFSRDEATPEKIMTAATGAADQISA